MGEFPYTVVNFVLKAPEVFASAETSFSLCGTYSTNAKGHKQKLNSLHPNDNYSRSALQETPFFVPIIKRRNNRDHINAKVTDHCMLSRHQGPTYLKSSVAA